MDQKKIHKKTLDTGALIAIRSAPEGPPDDPRQAIEKASEKLPALERSHISGIGKLPHVEPIKTDRHACERDKSLP